MFIEKSYLVNFVFTLVFSHLLMSCGDIDNSNCPATLDASVKGDNTISETDAKPPANSMFVGCCGEGCKSPPGGKWCYGDNCVAGNDPYMGGGCWGKGCKAGEALVGGQCFGEGCKGGRGYYQGGFCMGKNCTGGPSNPNAFDAFGIGGNCYGNGCKSGDGKTCSGHCKGAGCSLGTSGLTSCNSSVDPTSTVAVTCCCGKNIWGKYCTTTLSGDSLKKLCAKGLDNINCEIVDTASECK